MPSVKIYTTQFCGFCFAAKALLDDKKVAYTEIDVQDPRKRAALVQRANGRRTVPQIFIDDTHVGGYDELAALERSGKLDPMLAG